MAEPDEDSLRRQIQTLLAASPSRAELETSYAGRILTWLASPDMLLDTSYRERPKRGKKRSKASTSRC